jgi:hypothetical protein
MMDKDKAFDKLMAEGNGKQTVFAAIAGLVCQLLNGISASCASRSSAKNRTSRDTSEQW